MTVYDVLNIGFAGASAFTALINLLIYFRKREGAHEMLVVLLSFTLFIYYSILVMSGFAADNPELIMRYFRFRLLLIMLMAVIWLVYLHVFFKSSKRGYLFGSLALVMILILVNATTPVSVMFNLDKGGFSEGPLGGVIGYGHGYTLWRLLIDLTVIDLTVGGTLIMIHSYNKETQNSIFRFGTGMILLFLFAFYDHLVDFGIINFNYLFPYGLFLLLFLSMIEYLNKSVTEQESSEDALSRHRYMQAFLEETRFLIIRLNRMGQLIYANPQFYRLTGYSEQEVVGKDWFENFLPKNKTFDIQSIFLQIIDHQYSEVVQNPILGRNGREIQVEWYNTVLRDKNGDVYGVISLGVDITEKMKQISNLEKSLEEANAVIQKYRDDSATS